MYSNVLIFYGSTFYILFKKPFLPQSPEDILLEDYLLGTVLPVRFTEIDFCLWCEVGFRFFLSPHIYVVHAGPFFQKTIFSPSAMLPVS